MLALVAQILSESAVFVGSNLRFASAIRAGECLNEPRLNRLYAFLM